MRREGLGKGGGVRAKPDASSKGDWLGKLVSAVTSGRLLRWKWLPRRELAAELYTGGWKGSVVRDQSPSVITGDVEWAGSALEGLAEERPSDPLVLAIMGDARVEEGIAGLGPLPSAESVEAERVCGSPLDTSMNSTLAGSHAKPSIQNTEEEPCHASNWNFAEPCCCCGIPVKGVAYCKTWARLDVREASMLMARWGSGSYPSIHDTSMPSLGTAEQFLRWWRESIIVQSEGDPTVSSIQSTEALRLLLEGVREGVEHLASNLSNHSAATFDAWWIADLERCKADL